MNASYLCKEATSFDVAPSSPLVLKGELGSFSEPCLFQGWDLPQNFMASKKKILSLYKQEGMSLRSWRS